MLNSLWKISRTGTRLSPFLKLTLIIKIPLLSCQTKPLSIWLGPFLYNHALWGFAVKHAIWLHNCILNHLFGFKPLKLLTKTKGSHCGLLCTHVWGCPIYVIDPKLQDGQKIPKWNRWSRLGQFLGFSNTDASLVANVCHLSTGYIYLQYHLIFDFDDWFEIVPVTGNDDLIDDICNCLFDSDQDIYFHDDELICDGPLFYHLSLLDEVWLSEPEFQAWCQEIWLSSLIVTVKLPTVRLLSLFQRDEIVMLIIILTIMGQPNPSMLQRDHLPTCLVLFGWCSCCH